MYFDCSSLPQLSVHSGFYQRNSSAGEVGLSVRSCCSHGYFFDVSLIAFVATMSASGLQACEECARLPLTLASRSRRCGMGVKSVDRFLDRSGLRLVVAGPAGFICKGMLLLPLVAGMIVSAERACHCAWLRPCMMDFSVHRGAVRRRLLRTGKFLCKAGV